MGRLRRSAPNQDESVPEDSDDLRGPPEGEKTKGQLEPALGHPEYPYDLRVSQEILEHPRPCEQL
jgi:hypothetical protein